MDAGYACAFSQEKACARLRDSKARKDQKPCWMMTIMIMGVMRIIGRAGCATKEGPFMVSAAVIIELL